jgi:SlyX protein
MKDHIAEIEARLALAEDYMEALNRTVYRQQQQIDLLQQQLRHLHQQFQEGLPVSGERDSRDEVPPHY